MYRQTIWVVFAIAACKFDSSGLDRHLDLSSPPLDADSAPAGDGNVPDGNVPDTNTPDAITSDGSDAAIPDQATPDGPDPLCGWPFLPARFDPCTDPLVPGGNLVLDTDHVYDTDTAALSPAAGGVVSPPNSVVSGVRVIWIDGFSVSDNASLRVVGSMPLMIVSTGNITIAGDIDVSSFGNEAGGFDIGAGASADPLSCTAPPLPGARCDKHGASGGGGGGFASPGSGGDSGGVSHDCGDADNNGRPPTTGGAAISGTPTQIRAGCAGAAGDFTTEGGATINNRGEGGPGGGAIHLTAKGDLVVDGVIHAGGAGGTPGSDHRASGGGGGSGGYVGLEANDLLVTPSAILAANGGGGGGGCDNPTGIRGTDGQASTNVAAGGSPQGDGGRGNDGAYLAVSAETPDATIDRGGGGGGGGVGFILLYAPNQITVETGAKISPPDTRIP